MRLDQRGELQVGTAIHWGAAVGNLSAATPLRESRRAAICLNWTRRPVHMAGTRNGWKAESVSNLHSTRFWHFSFLREGLLLPCFAHDILVIALVFLHWRIFFHGEYPRFQSRFPVPCLQLFIDIRDPPLPPWGRQRPQHGQRLREVD